MDKKRKWFGGLTVVIGVLVLMSMASADEIPQMQQVVLSPTAQSVTIPTATFPATAGATSTPVPPTFTPTVPGPPQLTVRADVEETVVRREPILESEEVGTIRLGDQYIVTGRFFRWLQFRFDPSPTGSAWVYDELVEISGDQAQIPEVDASGQRIDGQGAATGGETQTAEALQLTPGFDLTQTADVRVIQAPGTAESLQSTTEGNLSFGLAESTDEVQAFGVLPTYTYPPNVVAQAPTDIPPGGITPTPMPGVVLYVSEGLAPIVPIVILASLGIIGLLLGMIRR